MDLRNVNYEGYYSFETDLTVRQVQRFVLFDLKKDESRKPAGFEFIWGSSWMFKLTFKYLGFLDPVP